MPLVSTPAARPVCRRVAIVDAHTAIVEMIQQVVESFPGYKVIGYARDASAARELCRREQPDVVILDLVPPRSSGLGLVGELRGICPRARVLVFSGHLRPALIRAALLMGAHGLVERTAPLEEFRSALRAVGQGLIYFSRWTSEEIRNIVSRRPARRAPAARLTERERSVLGAIAEGLSSKEISTRLGISVHTVIHHRSRLTRKTELKGIAQLSRYAVQIGLVDETVGMVPLLD
jgi:DNA-binding NarL/FixJ family response regulator